MNEVLGDQSVELEITFLGRSEILSCRVHFDEMVLPVCIPHNINAAGIEPDAFHENINALLYIQGQVKRHKMSGFQVLNQFYIRSGCQRLLVKGNLRITPSFKVKNAQLIGSPDLFLDQAWLFVF